MMEFKANLTCDGQSGQIIGPSITFSMNGRLMTISKPMLDCTDNTIALDIHFHDVPKVEVNQKGETNE